MRTKFTRRTLAGIVAGASLARSASAAQAAQPSAIPATPEEELAAARAQNRANAAQTEKVTLPVSTEPAAHFKA